MVLSADVVADLKCMPALSVMCVTVQSCDNKFEGQSCSSYVNDCMVAEVDASDDDDDDDDKSTVSVVDNADQLLVCLLYTSPSPRDGLLSRMPSSA